MITFKDFKKFQISSSNFHQIKGGYGGGGSGSSCERCNGTTESCYTACSQYECGPSYPVGTREYVCVD